jgi:hypothetical protein
MADESLTVKRHRYTTAFASRADEVMPKAKACFNLAESESYVFVGERPDALSFPRRVIFLEFLTLNELYVFCHNLT